MSDVDVEVIDEKKKGDTPDRKIDLDAARKARREKRGAPPSIVFLGDEHVLPHGLPADVLELAGYVAGGNWSQAVPAVRILLGQEVYDELGVKAREAGEPLELEDVVFLLEKVLEVYEVTVPESGASGSPS